MLPIACRCYNRAADVTLPVALVPTSTMQGCRRDGGLMNFRCRLRNRYQV